MNPHAIHPARDGEDAHREAQQALPWLANGSLAGAELERVQAHLQGCAQCRAELAMLHTLRGIGPGALPDCDPDAALARLLPLLDAPAVPAEAEVMAPAPGWRARLAGNDGRWLRAAVALQACAILVLGGLLLRPANSVDAGSDAYRVLGAAQGEQSRLVVSFRPDTPERELRRIVLDSGAHIVGGPTVTGAWMLGTEAPAPAVAARLRAQPAVTLAEPLGTDGRP